MPLNNDSVFLVFLMQMKLECFLSCFCFDFSLCFVCILLHFLHHQLLKAKMKEGVELRKKTYNTVHSFKPWKKNFLAQCLKCESMSRPTDDQNSVRSHKWTGKHMQKLRITQNKHPISITKNFGKIS